MQKAVLILRSLWFIVILNSAYALCASLAEPSLLSICLTAAWQAKSLIISAAKRSLRVLADSEFARSVLM
jgi:hypothetical protein